MPVAAVGCLGFGVCTSESLGGVHRMLVARWVGSLD